MAGNCSSRQSSIPKFRLLARDLLGTDASPQCSAPSNVAPGPARPARSAVPDPLPQPERVMPTCPPQRKAPTFYHLQSASHNLIRPALPIVLADLFVMATWAVN